MEPWTTLRSDSTRHRLLTLRQSLLLLVLLTPYSTTASSRRVNARFLDLSKHSNYSQVYRALDEGMRDPKRLDAAFRSVDLGRALNVFDVARAIVPGKIQCILNGEGKVIDSSVSLQECHQLYINSQVSSKAP